MFKEELPVDRGWAWVICLANFCLGVLITNSFQVLSVTLLDIVDEFDTTITTASLIFMFKVFCVSFSSIISVNFLVPKYGIRVLAVLAMFVYVVCGMLYAVVPNVGVFIALATIRGIMIGIISVPALSLVGFYFNKYRSIATTLSVCGMSISSITWPRLIRFMMTTCDLRGTLLINSAVEGNLIAVAMLFRPVDFYRKPTIDVTVKEFETVENALENGKAPSIKLLQPLDDKPLGHNHEPTPQHKISCDDILYSDRGSTKKFIQDAKHEFEFYEVDSATPFQNKPIFKKAVSQNNILKTFSGSQTLPIDYLSQDGPENEIESHQNNCNVSDENLAFLDESKPGPNDRLLCKSLSNDSQMSQCDGHHDFHRTNSQTSRGKEKSLLLQVFQANAANSYPDHDSPAVTTPDKINRHPSAWSLVSGLEPGLGVARSPEELIAEEKWTIWQRINEIFDFSLFKQWAFIWIIIATVPCGTNTFIVTYLPTMAIFKGVSKDDGANLLAIMGGMDLISRLLAGFVADSKRIRVTTILGSCGVCLGLICMFVSFYNDMNRLIIMAVCLGLFVGIRQSLGTIMFVEVVGLENMAKGFSIYTMLITISLASHNPLMSKMLESLGVDTVMYYIGGASFCWGLMYFLIPIVTRIEKWYKQSKASRKSKKSKNSK